jgi:hypothetical protein
MVSTEDTESEDRFPPPERARTPHGVDRQDEILEARGRARSPTPPVATPSVVGVVTSGFP